MRAGSQKILYSFINPQLTVLFLLLLFMGCTHFGFEKSASLPHIKIERSYFPNGNLEYEAEFINGKLDGTSRVWLEDGTLYSESEYSNGQPHGMWKRYHPNKSIMHEVQYKYGEKHGKEKWFYETKQIKSEQNFNNGEPETEIIRWKSDGTVIY